MFAVWLVRYVRSKDTGPPTPRIAWIVLVGAGVVGTVLMTVRFHIWQDDVRDLVGVPHLKWHDYPLTAVLAVLFALVEIGQLIRRLILFLIGRLNRVVPPRVSAVIAVLVVFAVIVGILNGVVLRLTMRTLNNTFETVNNEESPTSPPSTTMLRSGGVRTRGRWVIGLNGHNRPPVDDMRSRPRIRWTSRKFLQRRPIPLAPRAGA